MNNQKEEFEKYSVAPELAVYNEELDGYYWEQHPRVTHPFNETYESFKDGWNAAVPDGCMVVRKEWQPIMDEVDRRASKEWDVGCDFTVTIESGEYQALDEAERVPMPEGKCNE